MKRFTVIIILFYILVLLFTNVCYASEVNNLDYTKKRVETFLEEIGHPSKVKDFILLDKIHESDDSTVVFTLNEIGYVVVNLKDFSIPELSFETPNPFIGVKNPVYGGPLGYYSKIGGKVIPIVHEHIVELSENKKNSYAHSAYDSFGTEKSPIIERYINGQLKTWYTPGGHCGSIACAISMRYYYDYVSNNYANINDIGESNFIALMQNFVGAGSTSANDLVQGLNHYFMYRMVSNTAYSKGYFSFSTVKNKIINSRPVIVLTQSHPIFNNHWIIAHGYFESAANGKYIIVNNGWRSNNVWVDADASSLSDVVYLQY